MVTKSINMVRTFKTFDCYVHSKLSRKLALGTMRKSGFYVEHIANFIFTSPPGKQDLATVLLRVESRHLQVAALRTYVHHYQHSMIWLLFCCVL